jgi:hypothetical protein
MTTGVLEHILGLLNFLSLAREAQETGFVPALRKPFI